MMACTHILTCTPNIYPTGLAGLCPGLREARSKAGACPHSPVEVHAGYDAELVHVSALQTGEEGCGSGLLRLSGAMDACLDKWEEHCKQC